MYLMKKDRMQKSRKYQYIAGLLILIFIGTVFPYHSHAAKMDLVSLPFSLDGGGSVMVTAYESNYANNFFVSLRSLSKLLTGTISQFGFYNDEEGAYHVDLGMSYDPAKEPKRKEEDSEEEKPVDLTPPESTWLEYAANWLLKDGESVVYYTYADYSIEDLYMSLIDIQLLLDLNITYEDGIYKITTDQHFAINLDRLNEQGYFDYLHGVLLGDASTGEIFMGCHEDLPVPIASTTKLMTAMIAMRMIEIGKITPDDPVTVSANAARMSLADDSVIGMYAGEVTTVRDLLYAMLVMSSNESAEVLAEYIAGSQEEFVSMMNAMAFKLGMDTAVFYNPHGLPEYLKGDAVVMVENRASAKDMFLLSKAILQKYPEITEYTSVRNIWLDSLWVDLYTTNSLMYNMPDVFGLKTGTTDAAGKCLISSRSVTIDGREHMIVAVVLGAEFNSDRIQVSELLQKGVRYYFNKKAAEAAAETSEE